MDDLPYLWTWTFGFRTLGACWAPNSVPLHDQFWSLCAEVQLHVVRAALALLPPRRWFVRAVVAPAVTGPLLRAGLYLLLQAGGEPAFLRPFTVAQSPAPYLEAFGWLWQYMVVALFFGALVHCAGRGGAFARALSPRPLVRAGVISYGVYAQHAAVARRLSPHFTHAASGWSGGDLAYAALVLLGTFAAELSFRFL